MFLSQVNLAVASLASLVQATLALQVGRLLGVMISLCNEGTDLPPGL